MPRWLTLLVVVGVSSGVPGQEPPGHRPAVVDSDPLDALRRAAGWRRLFDGATFAGWRAVGSGGEPGPGWAVEDGCLHLTAGGEGGDLVSEQTFEDLELELTWSVAPGSDVRHARIQVRGDRIEHWLDGERLLVARVGDDAAARPLAGGTVAALEGFGTGAGHVVLRDQGDALCLRSIVARDRRALPGQAVSLDAGPELAGWRRIGDARYVGEGDTILGEVDGGAQSFLVTERGFGDFVLELDVRSELPGNSGIQVRSHQDPATARLVGYQIEIDPSERAWSGGLYDEARRGWLDDLEGDDAARAAYRHRAWNHYRIECIGPSIRAWVNGVPTADAFDVVDLEGVIGLQVHSGHDTRVRWRNLRLQDLGQHAWRPRPLDDEATWARSTTGRARWSRDETGLVCRGEGSDRLLLAGQLEDVALRVSFEGPGELVVRMLPVGDDAPLVAREPSDAVLGYEATGGWTVRPAGAGGGPHRLAVCSYGARRTVDLDGRRLAAADDVPGRGGRLVLEAHVAGEQWLRVTEVALLERLAR